MQKSRGKDKERHRRKIFLRSRKKARMAVFLRPMNTFEKTYPSIMAKKP